PGDRSTPSLEQRHRGRDDMTRPARSRTTAAVKEPGDVEQQVVEPVGDTLRTLQVRHIRREIEQLRLHARQLPAA
ncbi:hypothetical protein, partial [Streptomyces sp. NPDC006668]|uniref:hypothetical protein n=1 Tax=Streptomyces sp. NPDC006668 TaxID=3156903 RepID=UPI0033E91C4D